MRYNEITLRKVIFLTALVVVFFGIAGVSFAWYAPNTYPAYRPCQSGLSYGIDNGNSYYNYTNAGCGGGLDVHYGTDNGEPYYRYSNCGQNGGMYLSYGVDNGEPYYNYAPCAYAPSASYHYNTCLNGCYNYNNNSCYSSCYNNCGYSFCSSYNGYYRNSAGQYVWWNPYPRENMHRYLPPNPGSDPYDP